MELQFLLIMKSYFLKFWNFILPIAVFFFDPTQGRLFLALLILITFDSFAKAYEAYNKDEYNKKRFWTGNVSKVFKYFGAIAAARLLEYFFLGIPYVELDTYVLAVLALTEAKSFYGHLIRLGVNLPMLPKLEQLTRSITETTTDTKIHTKSVETKEETLG